MLMLCAGTAIAQSAVHVAARDARVSDAAIARDLAVFDSLARAPRGDTPFARQRHAAYAWLARDAYERNDEGTVTATLLDAAAGSGRIPRQGRVSLWALVDSMASPAAAETAVYLPVVALEEALIRAQYPVLGAPDCATWDAEALRLAQRIRTQRPPVVAAVAPAPAPPAPAPAPTPEPSPAPVVVTPPPPAVVGPETLSGIPSMVHFALDKSFLSAASRHVLDALVDSLNRYPDVRVVLEGHTDLRASVAYNLALSGRRVASVRAYLISRGIAASRLSGRPQGKSQLEVEGSGAMEHARNRRVQLRYFMPDGREIPAIMLLDDLQLETQRR